MSAAETSAPRPAGPLGVLRNPYLLFGLLALVQIGLLSLPLIDRLQVQASGQEVVLELVPIDPRDLLRGDYVIINLAINRIPAEVPGVDAAETGKRVFVELETGSDGLARAVKLSSTREELGQTAIAGTVVSVTGEEVRMDYGIDAFFLPEGEGLKIERLDPDKVRLAVAVTDDGRSLPLRLLVNGKPFKSDAVF